MSGMLGQVVEASVRHRGWTLGLTLALALAAALLALRMELDALPDITTNQVLVLTHAPGLTPEEVERRVTRPVETALGGMPGLVEHRSLSRYGLSAVTAVFEDEVDLYRARQLVQERLTALAGSLPPGVEAPNSDARAGVRRFRPRRSQELSCRLRVAGRLRGYACESPSLAHGAEVPLHEPLGMRKPEETSKLCSAPRAQRTQALDARAQLALARSRPERRKHLPHLLGQLPSIRPQAPYPQYALLLAVAQPRFQAPWRQRGPW